MSGCRAAQETAYAFLKTTTEMSDLLIDPTFYWLLTFHCLIGVVAAVLARRKGYSLGLWIVLGLIGGTAALIAALLMKEK